MQTAEAGLSDGPPVRGMRNAAPGSLVLFVLYRRS